MKTSHSTTRRRLRGTLAILASAFVFVTAGGPGACDAPPPGSLEPSQRPDQQEDATVEPPELPDEQPQEFSLVPAEEAAGDQSANQAAPNEPAWQGCLFNWMLDWPIEPSDSYALDATYGSNYSCDLPAMGGPTIDASIQTTVFDETTGEEIDQAEFVTGGWDTEDYIESSDTLRLDWPHEIRLHSHLEMQLIPGCDIAGCGDPDPGWVWGPMPSGCESPGPWLAVCEYDWENIQIGNTHCSEDSPSFADGANRVSFEVTCGGASGDGVSVSAEIHNASDDGMCTYAVAVFRGGPQSWDAVCEPGESRSVDLGSGEGPITHVYLTRIAY